MKLESKNLGYNHFADINTTTTLKGVAILIIIIHHVGVNGFFCNYFNPLGGIGVAMFLFLSGYGITESYKKNKLNKFWSKKIFRIIVPYLVWLPLYYISMQFSILASPNYFETIPRFWFIEYLLIMYTAFYFFFPLKNELSIVLICSLCIILFLVLNNLRAEQSLSFWTGVLFSLHKEKFAKNGSKRLFSIALLFFIIGSIALLFKQQLELMGVESDGIPMKATNLIIKLPIGLSIILLFFTIKNNCKRWFILLGSYSYELYLVHIPFFMTIDKKVVFLFIFIIQSVFLAYILHISSRFINKKIEKYV